MKETILSEKGEEHGEAFSLYCPIPCTAILASVELPGKCNTPGYAFINFYVGFDNDIEASVSRCDKFSKAHFWNRFMNATHVKPKPPHPVPQKPATESLDGKQVTLLLFRDQSTGQAHFRVNGFEIGTVPYPNDKPHVKMSIGASDNTSCSYNGVRFKVLAIRPTFLKPGQQGISGDNAEAMATLWRAPEILFKGGTALGQALTGNPVGAIVTIAQIPMGWEIQYAHGPLATHRMKPPSTDPQNFSNSLDAMPAATPTHTPSPKGTKKP
jgi:uncharacterized Zn-finger protein